jgi:hypothetical protein
MQRRQSIPHTFEGIIAAEKARLEAQVSHLPPGPQKDRLLKKISQLETASHVNEWLTSPGLQPPKPVVFGTQESAKPTSGRPEV